MARRSPRHPDSQRNAADPDSDHEASEQRQRARALVRLSASASPATPSRTTSATTCYAGTKMRSRRASDTQNISLSHRMRLRDQRRSRRGNRYSPDGLVGRRPDRVQKAAGRNSISRRSFPRRGSCRVPAAVPDWIARHRAQMVGFRRAIAAGCPCSSSASGRARKFSRPSSLQHRHSSNAWRLLRPDTPNGSIANRSSSTPNEQLRRK